MADSNDINTDGNDSDEIFPANTGNNDLEKREFEEMISDQIFGGVQQSTGIIGADNEGFIDDIGQKVDEEDKDIEEPENL